MRAFALLLVIPFAVSLISGCGEATPRTTNTPASGPAAVSDKTKPKDNPARRASSVGIDPNL